MGDSGGVPGCSGESRRAARWWPATTSFGCVLLMFWAGRRLFGQEIGLAAAAALGGCTGFVVNAHVSTLDAGLAAFLTVGLLGFLLASVRRDPGREKAATGCWSSGRRWRWLC
ncbi:MAG: glycosyltransferase family 39 protein [Candidatus Competibacteraceae bacterium]